MGVLVRSSHSTAVLMCDCVVLAVFCFIPTEIGTPMLLSASHSDLQAATHCAQGCYPNLRKHFTQPFHTCRQLAALFSMLRRPWTQLRTRPTAQLPRLGRLPAPPQALPSRLLAQLQALQSRLPTAPQALPSRPPTVLPKLPATLLARPRTPSLVRVSFCFASCNWNPPHCLPQYSAQQDA